MQKLPLYANVKFYRFCSSTVNGCRHLSLLCSLFLILPWLSYPYYSFGKDNYFIFSQDIAFVPVKTVENQMN